MLIRTPSPAAASSAAATATTTPSSSSAAPWRALFLQHLGQMTLPLCAVSTVRRQQQRQRSGAGAKDVDEVDGHDNGSGSDSDSFCGTPRVRNCVFRGMWAALPANPRNPMPLNPASRYESDLPVFTTDARMAKAWEVRGGSDGGGGDGDRGRAAPPTTSAALAGPVEAVWWAEAAGTQWRVRGRLWLLGTDVEGAAGAAAREVLGERMRGGEGEGGVDNDANWSWKREVLAHLGNLSPGMRGSFRNPAPGQRRRAPQAPGEGLGGPVTDADLLAGSSDGPAAEAQANFRVCVLVPEQVDQTDLSRGNDPRRWVYTYVGEEREAQGGQYDEYSNGWAKVEVWP